MEFCCKRGTLFIILVKKINDVTLNYPTYDKEMYTLVRSLHTWENYLVSKEFVNYRDRKTQEK